MNLSIVLPIFNEENVIEKSVQDFFSVVSKYVKNLELCAIDDGSTDKTAQRLESLRKKDKRIKIISHGKNKGYGAALKTGIQNASYEWIFFTDADMQFDASEIQEFIPFTTDYDFIVGYRKNRADSLRRKFISFVYNRIIRSMFSLKLSDVDCAFKLMRKSALTQIPITSDSFFVSVELMVRAYKAGYRIKELGVEHFPRKDGVSKVTYNQIFKTSIDLIRLYQLI